MHARLLPNRATQNACNKIHVEDSDEEKKKVCLVGLKKRKRTYRGGILWVLFLFSFLLRKRDLSYMVQRSLEFSLLLLQLPKC